MLSKPSSRDDSAGKAAAWRDVWQAMRVAEEDRRIEVAHYDDGKTYVLVLRKPERLQTWAGITLMKQRDKLAVARLYATNPYWTDPDMLQRHMLSDLASIRSKGGAAHSVPYTPAQMERLGRGPLPPRRTTRTPLVNVPVATFLRMQAASGTLPPPGATGRTTP